MTRGNACSFFRRIKNSFRYSDRGEFNRLPNRWWLDRRFEPKRSSDCCVSFPIFSPSFARPLSSPFYFDLFFLLIRFPTLLVSSAGRAKNTGICRFPGEEQRKRPQQEISSYSKPRLAFPRVPPSHETSRYRVKRHELLRLAIFQGETRVADFIRSNSLDSSGRGTCGRLFDRNSNS